MKKPRPPIRRSTNWLAVAVAVGVVLHAFALIFQRQSFLP